MAATAATTPPITAAGWLCEALEVDEDDDELSSPVGITAEDETEAGVPARAPDNAPS